MRSMRFVLVLSAALAASLALSMAGCGNSPAPPANSSGMRGLMVMEGGVVSSRRPLSNVQIEVRQGDKTGHVVEQVKSGADGKFTVNLPPGHYTVAPIARGDELVIPASAAVNPGRYVHATVTFSVR